MVNTGEYILELKKYLAKLIYVIDNNAKLTLFNKKIADKVRLDDILCCIESCFPDVYKDWIKKHGQHSLRSYKLYLELTKCIRNKTIFGSNNYAVYYKQARLIISEFLSAINFDVHTLMDKSSSSQ